MGDSGTRCTYALLNFFYGGEVTYLAQEVRDIKWMESNRAVAGVSSDIYIISLGNDYCQESVSIG